MSPEQKAELDELAVRKRRADDAVRYYGYINVAGRTAEELDDIARRGAQLEAEAVEANARYRVFMARLDRETAEAFQREKAPAA